MCRGWAVLGRITGDICGFWNGGRWGLSLRAHCAQSTSSLPVQAIFTNLTSRRWVETKSRMQHVQLDGLPLHHVGLQLQLSVRFFLLNDALTNIGSSGVQRTAKVGAWIRGNSSEKRGHALSHRRCSATGRAPPGDSIREAVVERGRRFGCA